MMMMMMMMNDGLKGVHENVMGKRSPWFSRAVVIGLCLKLKTVCNMVSA